MKIFKYMLFFAAVLAQPLFAVSQDPAADNRPEAPIESAAEQVLSAEELAHKKLQEQFDRDAIERTRQIRGNLRSFVKNLRKVSPAAADFLVEKFFGIRVIQYIAAVLILCITFFISKFLLAFVFAKLLVLSDKLGKNGFLSLFVRQIQLPVGIMVWGIGLYFALAFLINDDAAIAIMSRAVGVGFGFGFFWAIVIISDVFFMVTGRRFYNRSAASTANLMDFMRRVVKVVIIIIAILSILSNCGVNVNTIVASLGIGGMALAFASQDTIANFFGSVSIIIDRPFIVGDWVKTSVCEGHVETIGFRSTRIRTFQKTLVTIPNSALAKESVENFTKMPSRKVVQVIGVTYSTTSAQMEKLMEDLRAEIIKVAGVDASAGVMVEFLDFAASSLDLTVVYYTKDIAYVPNCAVRRAVNLKIMDIVEANGLSFAFPSTSVYVESMPEKSGGEPA